MDTDRVPAALRERLGPNGTSGLIELLDETKKACTVEVIEIVGDRFERRLVQETSGLRIEMTRGFAGVRLDLAEGLAAVRKDLVEGLAAVRKDMVEGLAAAGRETADGLAAARKEAAEGFAAARKETAEGLAALRHEMSAGFAGVRQEMAEQRFVLLKWAFLFWIGQFFAVGSLIAVLVRFLHAGS